MGGSARAIQTSNAPIWSASAPNLCARSIKAAGDPIGKYSSAFPLLYCGERGGVEEVERVKAEIVSVKAESEGGEVREYGGLSRLLQPGLLRYLPTPPLCDVWYRHTARCGCARRGRGRICTHPPGELGWAPVRVLRDVVNQAYGVPRTPRR
eukprot:3290943-Rhodomonas_salina.1